MARLPQEHRAGRRVDAVEQAPILQLEVGVPPDGLPLQLELEDRHRLLHARQEQRVPQVLAPGPEALRGVVAVGLPGEVLHRFHRDAVALLELGDAAVPQRHPVKHNVDVRHKFFLCHCNVRGRQV